MISDGTFHRDFKWLLSCPSLLSSNLILDTEYDEDTELNFSPAREFLESKASHRVGYYVESLVEVWLKQQRGISEFQHALQVQNSKRTLGELDFLYQLNGILNHLEVTLKFYLYESNENHSQSHFVGPKSSDTFEKKRDKLLQKQIPLGREQFPEIDVSQIMMKGMIFYPPGIEKAGELAEGLNPKHRSGIWLRRSDCDWLSAASGFEYGMILKKPFWLSGLSSDGDQPVQRINQLRESVAEHFQVKQHPLVMSLADSSGNETARVFVVADQWPDLKH